MLAGLGYVVGEVHTEQMVHSGPNNPPGNLMWQKNTLPNQ